MKCLTRKKQHAYNHACATNTSHDWVEYKDIKRQCQHECRKCFNQYVSTLIDPSSNAITKYLWSYKKQEVRSHRSWYLKTSGIYLTDSQDKAQLLADYFTSVPHSRTN